MIAQMVTKAASDPQIFAYPPKKEWWALAMARKPDACSPPGSQYNVN